MTKRQAQKLLDQASGAGWADLKIDSAPKVYGRGDFYIVRGLEPISGASYVLKDENDLTYYQSEQFQSIQKRLFE